MRNALAVRLLGLYRKTSARAWPWFEDVVSYDNPRLSQALLVAGAWMQHEEMIDAGLRSLGWLATIQCSEQGYFAPVGSNGFFVRGGTKAAFDQQPVDAYAMISACLEARRVTGDPRWTEHARRAMAWFLGHNHLQLSLYDPVTGGCRDGLHADRANENQGAESTLSFQLALLEMHGAERPGLARSIAREATA